MNKAPVRRENNRLALLWSQITVDKARFTTFKVVRKVQYDRYFSVIFFPNSHSPLVMVVPVMLTRLILNYS